MPENARHLAAVPDRNDRGEANNLRIERHVLGTAMEASGELAAMRIHITGPASFADPRHGEIWAAICQAADTGKPTHPTAITQRVIQSGLIGRLPNAAYMFELVQQALPGQGAYWAQMVAEQHGWRATEATTAKLGNALRTPGASLDRIAELAQDVIAATATSGTGSDGEHIADLAADYLATYHDVGGVEALPTPWGDLNRALTVAGFEPGQLVTFGGSTGMGKSVALTDCVRNYAVDQQAPSLMFTMEMTAQQVMFRVLAGMTGIPEKAVKTKTLNEQQLTRVEQAYSRFRAAPLWIFEGKRSVADIAKTVRAHRRQHGNVKVVAVDYLQLVHTEGKRENRQLEVSAIVQDLKALALKDGLLMLTASQINRGPNQRTDKRPALSDLRESGEIENSSDVVILIYREDRHDPESIRAGEADFIIAKQRGGGEDTVTLAAQLHLTRFVSMAEDHTTWAAA